MSNNTRKLVLVVDDYDTELIALFLKQLDDVLVATAESAEEAFVLTAGTKFDLYLFDGSMPVMDGFTLAENLRARGDDTPIIFLTAHMSEVVEPHAEAVKACGVIEKPIDPDHLLKRVREVLDRPQVGPQEAPCADGMVM